jgi:rhamnosyl/mannosyltransferase
MVWYKGLSELLRAAARIPNASLLLIGDGPLRDAIEDEAKRFMILDRVYFAGTVSHAEKVRYLQMMDIFALPSTHITEAFGVSQIEAQICSLPLVSTRLPTGVSDINIDGVTGLVVPPGDVEALATALDALKRSKELRKSYGTHGRKRALELISERGYISKLKAGSSASTSPVARPDRAARSRRHLGKAASAIRTSSDVALWHGT